MPIDPCWSPLLCLGLLFVTQQTNAATHRNIDYLPNATYADNKDRLDLHMPRDAKQVPVLVYFHGGALMFGDKSLADPVAKRLLPLDIAVVSANYRLSPGFEHPAHVQDAAAALAWTVRNIASYGGDTEQIYVAGHSAGAYLAALLALDASHLQAHSLGLDAIAGAVLVSPFLYVEQTAKDRPKTVWGTDSAAWLGASVTPHIAPGKPPFLLLYADGDEPWRKQQITRFSQDLQATNNRTADAIEIVDRDHRSLISRINEPSDTIGSRIASFVEAH